MTGLPLPRTLIVREWMFLRLQILVADPSQSRVLLRVDLLFAAYLDILLPTRLPHRLSL
jgi:hypothetical protein